MTTKTRGVTYLRTATVLAGLFLPSLTLLPLGSLWLWQHGYLLHWAIGAAALVASAYAIQHNLIKRPRSPTATAEDDESHQTSVDSSPDPTWTSAEQQAWAEVLRVSKSIDVAKLTSRESVLTLGAETVRAVAQRLHPEVRDPIWQFTVPEAFAILERVARRLGDFTGDNIPLSDRLTVAQALSLYRWRGALEWGGKAYDIWRFLRLANPVTAATHELRERLSQQMLQWGQAHVTRRLAQAYVMEVGRAAIDLYGGRLHVAVRHAGEAAKQDPGDAATGNPNAALKPLRILIAGQTGVGKSSLVNALATEVQAPVDALPATSDFQVYGLQRDGLKSAILVDSPGLGTTSTQRDALVAQAGESDLILWVIPAHRADRQGDVDAIAATRAKLAGAKRTSPLIVVLSNIDRLRPMQDWAPPYDLRSTTQPKAVSIRQAIDAVSHDLGLPPDDVIPVSLRDAAGYNIDALWARIFMLAPDAHRAQLSRHLADVKLARNWRRVWSQAAGAGRILAQTLLK